MREQIDPKELKTLSDILALVLDDQPGQAIGALEKARARARANHVTAGALKNLFVAIAPNPPAAAAKPSAAKPRAPRAGSAAANEIQVARTRISQLSADVNRLDLDLRGASARIEALRSELHLTRQARAEAQAALAATRSLAPRKVVLFLVALCGLLIGVASTSAVMLAVRPPLSDPAATLQ